MNPRDVFKRLPTVSELLDKPQVRAVVDRVPVKDVTERARKFLDRVYREVERRSADISIPSIGELAERAARFLLNEHEAQPHVVINATGRLWSDALPSPPLPVEASERMTRLAEGYWQVVAGRLEVERRVARQAGAEAALALNSHASALCLAMSAIGSGGAAIARGDMGTLVGGARVADLASLAGCPSHEVGASDRVMLGDYESSAVQSGGVIQIDLDLATTSGDTVRVDAADLAASVHRQGGILIHDIGGGALSTIEPLAELPVASAAEAIASGADLVVLRGDGWIGGPSCGIVVGKQRLIDQLAESGLARMTAAGAETLTALAATLDCHLPPEQAKLRVPVVALTTAPIENLQTRAERLAPQIADAPDVAAAAVADIPADAAPAGMPRLASVAIEVTPAASRAESLRRQLAEAAPPVLFVDRGATWQVNLRTVLPSQDIALVSAFRPVPEADGGTPTE